MDRLLLKALLWINLFSALVLTVAAIVGQPVDPFDVCDNLVVAYLVSRLLEGQLPE